MERRRNPQGPINERLDLRSIGALLLRRRWVLLIPFLSASAAGFIIGHPKVLKPIYQCSSTLMLEYPQTLSGALAKFVPSASIAEQLSRLQNQIQSASFLKKVIVGTGMDKDPSFKEWAKRNRARYPDLTEEELVDLRLMKLLRQSIRMTSPQVNIFRIAVEDQIPERARLISSTLTRAVIEANESARLDLLRSTHDFSLEQLALYKTKLADSEERLEDARQRIAAQQNRPSVVSDANRDEAWSLLQKSESEVQNLESEYNLASDSLAVTRPRLQVILLSLQDTGWLAEAVRGQEALEKKYLELTLRPSPQGEDAQSVAIQQARDMESIRGRGLRMLASGYPDLDVKDREVVIGSLLVWIRRSLTSFRAEFLRDRLEEHQSRVVSQPEYELEVRRIQEEVETNRALYNAFVQQIAAAEISEAFESTSMGGRITVLEPPQRPLKPVRPNRRALLILSVLVGMAAGLGGVFFLEQHDPTLRDVGHVESSTGLTVLGTLPPMKDLVQIFSKNKNGKLITTDKVRLRQLFMGDHQAYHECRKIYLDLVRHSDTPVRTVLVTSARAGEGKTTAAAFLAVTIAREDPQSRVVVVDLDTRRPSLHKYFGYDVETPGVHQILGEGQNPEDVLLPVWPSNLRVLPLGPRKGARSLTLTAEMIRNLLAQLRPWADYILLDSPPNLPVPDALVAGQEVDAVLLVVRAGETPRRLVQRGVELQIQFSNNVRGIVLNNASEALPSYEDYYGYGYGGRA